MAASAAALSVGWPGYKWSEVSEVLLYPDDFDRDYAIGRPELSGMAHVWGTVILSVPSLRHSFAHYEDPYHLGVHEFAHLLTYARGQQIRVPVGLPDAQIQLWEAIQAHELARIAEGESILASYALQPSEFFPCAVEAFFQKPIELRDAHRRLYRFLSRYFRQSPGFVGVQVSGSFFRLKVILHSLRSRAVERELRLDKPKLADSPGYLCAG